MPMLGWSGRGKEGVGLFGEENRGGETLFRPHPQQRYLYDDERGGRGWKGIFLIGKGKEGNRVGTRKGTRFFHL